MSSKRSVEERVEDACKRHLDQLGIEFYRKVDRINDVIDTALSTAKSKSGGKGGSYPDIRMLIELPGNRHLPVMVEVKGRAGKLIKLDGDEIELVTVYSSDGSISKKTGKPTHLKGDFNYSTVSNYAVNGAVYYALAVLDSDYDECLAVGVNGSIRDGDLTLEYETYYLSERNHRVPKRLDDMTDFSFLCAKNRGNLSRILDDLALSEEELERKAQKLEETLEKRVKAIHQRLYDAEDLRNLLQTNEKLHLFCGLIMAGLPVEGQANFTPEDLKGNSSESNNDGTAIMARIEEFLRAKGRTEDKVKVLSNLLSPVFTRREMWRVHSGVSLLKSLFRQVYDEIIPCLDTDLRLDFTGKILNSLNDWVHIENDKQNDVVLTPRFVTDLMARLARTDRDSFVWDSAMGSAGMLVSALSIMERDAEQRIKDADELVEKKRKIHEKQLLGIEILGNIYVLAVLNMILMGDGSSNVLQGDSFNIDKPENFPANVFLLNPPYSAPGKGLNFVLRAVKAMECGYACVLIQENAGSGNGDVYASEILKHATLEASIHMPDKLFHGKSSVQTAIYLFKVNRPHEEDDLVTFIDFSNDGYARSNRRKSSQEVNLRDVDDAKGRYAEVLAHILGKIAVTDYYTEENGLLIRDNISLNGDDWTFTQHRKLDLRPTEEDLRKTVADYLSWRVSQAITGGDEQ